MGYEISSLEGQNWLEFWPTQDAQQKLLVFFVNESNDLIYRDFIERLLIKESYEISKHL